MILMTIILGNGSRIVFYDHTFNQIWILLLIHTPRILDEFHYLGNFRNMNIRFKECLNVTAIELCITPTDQRKEQNI